MFLLHVSVIGGLLAESEVEEDSEGCFDGGYKGVVGWGWEAWMGY